MKEFFKVAGQFCVVLFATLGFALTLAMVVVGIPFSKAFTEDYIHISKKSLDVKIEAFKDSCLKHVDNPDIYSKYADSTNKYVFIYNYLQIPK